jgi:hypothetical protein
MPRGSKSATWPRSIPTQFSIPNADQKASEASIYSVYRWELGIQNWKLRIIVLLTMTVYL